MKKSIIIAPHFDDELLGCGGTMLRKSNEGHITAVILITNLFNKNKNEIKSHPFPRSKTSVTALANLRGSESGFKKAEAFQLLKSIV